MNLRKQIVGAQEEIAICAQAEFQKPYVQKSDNK